MQKKILLFQGVMFYMKEMDDPGKDLLIYTTFVNILNKDFRVGEKNNFKEFFGINKNDFFNFPIFLLSECYSRKRLCFG